MVFILLGLIDSVTVGILVPAPLRGFAGGRTAVRYANNAVIRLVSALSDGCPNVGTHLYSSSNRLHHFIGFCIGDRSVHFLSNGRATLGSNSRIDVIPTITKN